MAVINTGMVPKAIGGVSTALPKPKKQKGAGSLLGTIKKLAKRELSGGAPAMHNDGGCAYCPEGGMAHPCGR